MTLFTDIQILRRLSRTTLTRFLQDHKQWLPADALALLDTPLNHEEFCAAWAAKFKSHTNFGKPLLQALEIIERFAHPKNAAALTEALSHLPEGFKVNRNSPPLNQSLQLFIITGGSAHRSISASVKTGQKTGASVNPSISASVDQSTETPMNRSTETPAAPVDQSIGGSVNQSIGDEPKQSKIANQNSKIGEEPDQSKIKNQKSKIPDESTTPALQLPSEPPTTEETEDQTLERLAKLDPPAYDRARKAEAKRLHMRLATLDQLVNQVRDRLDDEEAAKAILDEIEPWPEPITDAPGLFDQVHDRYTTYSYLPLGAATVLSMFVGHTHAFAAFHYTPRINIRADKEDSGKTTVMKVIAALVPRAIPIHNLRLGTIYRIMDPKKRKRLPAPVVLFDEIENYLLLYREMVGLLNAGNSSDVCVPRCEGKTIRIYKPFAPVVLAGIGDLFRTLRSRSILIHMTPAPEGANLTRFDPDHLEIENELKKKLARWALDNLEKIAACNPPLPPGCRNRKADNWRVLFQIAHVVGGHWPQRVLEAYYALSEPTETPAAPVNQSISGSVNQSTGGSVTQSTETPVNRSTETPASDPSLHHSTTPALQFPATLNSQLLSDLRLIFAQAGSARLLARDLAARLNALPNRPWSQIQRGRKPITESWLGRRLRSLGIRSRNLRLNSSQSKGYHLDDFASAFSRFLSDLPPKP